MLFNNEFIILVNLDKLYYKNHIIYYYKHILMEEKKIHTHYLQDNNLINSMEMENNIYVKNKEKNEEKILFFKFLIYNTKIEMHIDKFLSYFYWVSLIEFFIWLVLLMLFISSPRTMSINWLFIYHVARGSIGIFILFKTPGTHQVIDNIADCENSSLEEIQKNLELKYAELLQENTNILKPLLISYFVITIIGFVIDLLALIIIALNIESKHNQLRNFVVLVSLVIFISIML